MNTLLTLWAYPPYNLVCMMTMLFIAAWGKHYQYTINYARPVYSTMHWALAYTLSFILSNLICSMVVISVLKELHYIMNSFAFMLQSPFKFIPVGSLIVLLIMGMIWLLAPYTVWYARATTPLGKFLSFIAVVVISIIVSSALIVSFWLANYPS